MRLMIIAGEASGDLHAGGVVRAIKALRPDAQLFGIGGDTMRDAGMELMHHVREMSFLGFAEVVKHLPFIRRVLRECTIALRSRRPDAVLLVDYPGFNIKFAGIAHAMGIRVYYYISPQVWAWKASRLAKMKECVDKMFVVFPFETAIYERAGIPVEFVGHPLVSGENTGSVNVPRPEAPAPPLVGLFPGSRAQEIHRMMPVFMAACDRIAAAVQCRFAIAAAPTVSDAMIARELGGRSIEIVRGDAKAFRASCAVALTKSGTTTLELTLADTPMVVMYRTSALSYLIGKAFATITHIALPNIIAGRTVVPEFIQNEATPARLANEVIRLLRDESARTAMRRDLADVAATLGDPGAAERVARGIVGAP